MGIRFEFLRAGKGDCILVSTDEGTNILIDGGDTGTSENIKEFLEENNVESIDLAILTHLDKDHIKGLIELLEEDTNKIGKNSNYTPLIKEAWFNSFKNTINKNDEWFRPMVKSNNLSMNHQISFTKLMKSLNDKIKYKDYLSIDFKRTFQIGEIEIYLLSPNQEKLDKLYKKYKKEVDSTNLSSSDYCKDFRETIDELSSKKVNKSADSSVANGSSIAFILTYQEKKFLFLGDAHIHLITEELEDYKKNFNNNQKIKFEFIKLSHHGSRNNINHDFLKLVDTENYIILTDSKGKNRHPDKETLSKIIVHHKLINSKANFIFNYADGANSKRYDFSKKDIKKYGNIFDLLHQNSYIWSM